MKIVGFLLLAVLVVACLYFSYTDLKYNQIKNRALIVFGAIAVALDVIYYGVFRQSAIVYEGITLLLIVAISIGMYAMHIWAAGDSKFMMLLVLLVPPSCSEREIMLLNEVMIPVYAFGVGFLYLIVDTGIHVARKEYCVTRGNFVDRIKNAARQFFINSVYVVALLKIEDFVLRKWGLQLGTFQLLFNVCLLILIGKVPALYNRAVFGFILGTSVLYSFGTGVWMVGPIRLLYYAISFLYVVFQIFIAEFNYQEIKTEDVRSGMILSMGTSMNFLRSRVKGLPGVSFEDMRSRITIDEADAIRRWGKSKNGSDKVVIVRKVPFALFISIGCMMYLLIRGVR